ncbi:MAG TPA: MotA/TolQ/ExbB proton channel family protein [Verrucomicrobiae bacterium]|nr:MotA/TolQ/ExbB proton channel family protein [Verrucomicrobiae bacterium]
MNFDAALQQMLHTWENGGWVMAALVCVAMVTYGTAARLLMFLHCRGLTKATDADLGSWVKDPSHAPGKIRELIRYTQDEVHSLLDIEGRFREVEAAKVPEADRRLAFVNVMVVSAPLFGLLGTVLGMLLTFRAIGVGGGSASDIIAKGISEALVATQTGMMVAIPGLVLAYVAKRWRNEYVAFLVRLEGITLRHFRPQFHGMTRVFVRSKDDSAQPAQPAQPAEPVEQPEAREAHKPLSEPVPA